MTETKITPRFKTKYAEVVVPALQEEFKYENVMQTPKIVKVVVNMGVGEAARDAKLMDGAIRDLTAITGQKPIVTRAKKSIAQFKLREGMPIGAHVTLRGDRMWEFHSDRQVDGNANYTFGLTEQALFHAHAQATIARQRGMDITVVTSAKTDDEGRAILKALGFPFKTK